MNDLLRAYGEFRCFPPGPFPSPQSLHVKNNAISAISKPFFKNVKVYDRRKDKGQGIFHQAYEMLIGGVRQAS